MSVQHSTFHDEDWGAICHRAGGRRRYNAWRRCLTEDRRSRLINLMMREKLCWSEWGVQAALARRFGVHRSTIGRDINAMLFPGRS